MPNIPEDFSDFPFQRISHNDFFLLSIKKPEKRAYIRRALLAFVRGLSNGNNSIIHTAVLLSTIFLRPLNMVMNWDRLCGLFHRQTAFPLYGPMEICNFFVFSSRDCLMSSPDFSINSHFGHHRFKSQHKKGRIWFNKMQVDIKTLNGNGFSSFCHLFSLFFCVVNTQRRCYVVQNGMPSITIKIFYPSDCNNFYSKVFFPLEMMRSSLWMHFAGCMIFKPQHRSVALLN